MFKFLLKGILRDHHRSLFPIVIVVLGVSLTVLAHCWINGILGDMIDFNAKYSTGHVKIVTNGYEDNMDQMPVELALGNVDELLAKVRKDYPKMEWVERIRFGGLIDAPDNKGETRAQGPALGLAVDLLSPDTKEVERLNINKSIVRGKSPEKNGEILISDELADKLKVIPGQIVTLMTSTMYGSMAMQNYIVSGTIKFGVTAMDKGAMILDITDAKYVMDMQDEVSEILGYFSNGIYNNVSATTVQNRFNAAYKDSTGEFAPVMLKLRDQNELASMLDYISRMISIFISVFVLAMSIVLWNAGLLGGLRRYGEMGLRLAIGEFKGRVYRSLIYESVIVGFIGSAIGTIIGLGAAFYLQEVGLDFSDLMQNATVLWPGVFRAKITLPAYYIGFIPGLISTVIGTMLSGIGIYKRQTAQLFKELET
ncbi:MAG: ABC transporter permease [Calditrichaceae bacterium]|nr:ABC transporter permease [Calditrichaceae bacterium]